MNASAVRIVIGLLVLFWAVGAYRRLRRQRAECLRAFESVPPVLRRRHELVPALVETAGAYLKQERALLESTVAAVNAAIAADTQVAGSLLDARIIRHLGQAERHLDIALADLTAAVERSPEARADANLEHMLAQLHGATHRVAVVAEVYDRIAAAYDAARGQFPGVLIAIIFAFRPAALLYGGNAPMQEQRQEQSQQQGHKHDGKDRTS